MQQKLELQAPPASSTCPLPGCLAPAAQRLLGHAHGIADTSMDLRCKPSHFLATRVCAAADARITTLLSPLPLHRNLLLCGSFAEASL